MLRGALSAASSSACSCSPLCAPVSLRSLVQRAGRGRARSLVCQAERRPRQQDNVLVVGLVSALTESLRALGVGKERFREVLEMEPTAPPPAPGDTQEVMKRITEDFKQGYIITGLIDDSIYDKDCWFADPTVSFSGLELWKRNLQLLVPFLLQPEVKLLSLQEEEDGVLKSEWLLRTTLKLPWRPLISIIGRTEYRLNVERNKVMEHIESWNVSGFQAILQMLKPGPPQEKAA